MEVTTELIIFQVLQFKISSSESLEEDTGVTKDDLKVRIVLADITLALSDDK